MGTLLARVIGMGALSFWVETGNRRLQISAANEFCHSPVIARLLGASHTSVRRHLMRASRCRTKRFIVRCLFRLGGALKKELLQHLRRTRTMRRSRHFTQKTPDHGWPDQEHRSDPPAASRRRRSSGAGSLTRRSAMRHQEQPDPDTGGAT